jgi:hypothetical protein
MPEVHYTIQSIRSQTRKVPVRPLRPPCRHRHALTEDNVLAYTLHTLGQRVCRLCVRAGERPRRTLCLG